MTAKNKKVDIEVIELLLDLYKNNWDFSFVGGKNGIDPRNISTLRHRIYSFEEKTGIKIFEDDNKTFTEHFKKSLPYFEKIIDEYNSVIDMVDDKTPESIFGTISIYVTKALPDSWVSHSFVLIAAEIANENSIIIKSNDIFSEDDAKNADILFRPLKTKPKGFNAKWFIEVETGIFSSERYLSKAPPLESKIDLLNHKIIDYGDSEFSGYEEINWLTNGYLGIPPITPKVSIDNTASLIKYTENGIGVAGLPLLSGNVTDTKLVRVLPKVSGPKTKIYFATRNKLKKEKKEFANYIGKKLKEKALSQGFKVKDIKH